MQLRKILKNHDKMPKIDICLMFDLEVTLPKPLSNQHLKPNPDRYQPTPCALAPVVSSL